MREDLYQKIGITEEQEARLITSIIPQLKEEMAGRQKIDKENIDLPLLKVRNVEIDYQQLAQLIGTMADEVYLGDKNKAIKTEKRITLELAKSEHEREIHSVRNLVDKILKEEYIFSYPAPKTVDQINSALDSSKREINGEIIQGFIQKWGIENATNREIIEELLEKKGEGSGTLEEIMNAARKEYKGKAEEEIKDLTWVKYRLAFRQAFFQLKQTIGNERSEREGEWYKNQNRGKEKRKMKVLGDNVLSNKFFCIDLETTCLDPKDKDAGIVEVYYQVVENDQKIDEFEKIYYHEAWEHTKDIHKIPEKDIVGKPTFMDSLKDKEEIKRYLKECADPKSNLTLMAHYAPFEQGWLRETLGITKEDKWFDEVRVADTRSIAKILEPEESHKLYSLCDKYGIHVENFHRSKEDVHAMYEVFKKQRPEIEKAISQKQKTKSKELEAIL